MKIQSQQAPKNQQTELLIEAGRIKFWKFNDRPDWWLHYVSDDFYLAVDKGRRIYNEEYIGPEEFAGDDPKYWKVPTRYYLKKRDRHGWWRWRFRYLYVTYKNPLMWSWYYYNGKYDSHASLRKARR